MGNGKGLKQQWGVGDPAKPGSDQQSKSFQAAFQKQIGVINSHLQYTSANAEAARHDPLAKRRDALYPDFQSALGQVDPKNPAKAKGAIDKVLADAQALLTEVASFRKEAQKAHKDWQARQAKFDTAVHQVEELESWEDAKAPPLRGLVDGIRTQVNERRHGSANKTLDELLPKLKPIYEDYQKQKAAKPKYEQALAEQAARLEALKGAERPSAPMTAKAGEADTALAAARTKGDAKDFVVAMEEMGKVKSAVDALDKLAKDPQRVKFLADRKAIEDLVATPPEVQFKVQEADWNDIVSQRQTADPTADAGDYAGANKALAEVKTKVAAFKKKHEELSKAKTAYEPLAATLTTLLAETTAGTYPEQAAVETDIATIRGQMETAAQGEDFAQALKLATSLKPKAEAYAKEFKRLKQQAQDEQDYTTALGTLKPKLADALVQARAFPPMATARAQLASLKKAMEAAATAKDFAKALKLARDLEPKVDAYLAKATTEEEKYKKKGDELAKLLDDASDATRADVAKSAAKALKGDEIAHLPTAIRNRLLSEMQKGGLTDDEKAACKKLFSRKYLDPEFEKLDQASREKMIEKLKTDPEFKEARKNWHKLTEAERVAIMQKAVDYQADAYGIPKTTIATYSKNDATDLGYYDHDDGKLYINSHDKALKNNGFDEAIDTAVHENGHRYQSTLIDDLNSGKLKPGDPLYNQAMTFKLNDTKPPGFYVQPPEDGKKSPDTGDEYFTQPQENHSRITGAAVQRARIGR